MSSDIKILLKEARESLRQNEYTEAMKICKKVLKKEKHNYKALILLAAAMREIDEFKSKTSLVLEKAIDSQPDNPLAWQGLVAYYEKEEDCSNWDKLLVGYCRLLQLDGNSPKFMYMLDKVSELSLKLKDAVIFDQVIETLSVLRKTSDKEKTKQIDKTLVWIFTENSDSADKHKDLLETVIASVIQDNNVVNRQEYYRRYLKVLYEGEKLTALIAQAIEMHKQFPQDAYPLEYICRVYYEETILNGNSIEIDIEQYYQTLLTLNVKSETAIIAKAIHFRTTDNLINGREILNQVLVSKPTLFYAWVTLSEICGRLYCWEDAENAARKALQLGNGMKSRLLQKLELTVIESMSRSICKQKWSTALQLCENLLKKEPSSLQLQLLRTRANILLNNPGTHMELNDLESQSEVRVQSCILRALDLKMKHRLEEAANALDSALECSEAWLLLGQIYWEMAEYNHSLMAFLNGVKADRYNWECLIYLGRYYREHGNDVERSRRCYQTALQINPNSEEAGIGLSTAYRLLKNHDANVQLLQRLTMQESGPKWAWLQLGLEHLEQGDAVQAIKEFQHVIRADPNENHSWESLADAYLVRGAYTSALRSYQRALEIAPDSLYPLIQLANIKLLIGQYSEAKHDFEHILLHKPNYVPALKGFAETCLGLAKKNFARQFLGRSQSNLQQAVDNLTSCIRERNDISCVWKLLGDACYRTAVLSEKYCYLNVTTALMTSDRAEERITIKQPDIFLLAARCYCRALSLSPDSALLFHDLSCCYFMQLQLDSSADRKNLANKCLAAAKHAVKLCSTSWLHWNFLGVVCMSPYVKNYALAQHAFIMAIDRELNNAVVWTNLGTLYLHIGNLYKANEAYSQAQRSDPAYINSWIGQGCIAEKMHRKEAMDLFRHSTQLGYHNEAAVGYAHWILTLLLNRDGDRDSLYTYMVNNMHAVSVATDALNWYIEHSPNDCYARNAYGLLLERQKLYRSAEEQFKAALRLSSKEHKDHVRLNLARVLIQSKRFTEAVELCLAIENINFNSQCHLALSLFKAKNYEQSYIAYEGALQWLANTSSEKANTLCAMAAMAYIFQGVDDVKTLLFQCIQIQPPTITGFLAAASLGILHGDLNLTTLVLKELKPYENHSKYGHDIANLAAYSYLLQNKISDAVTVLSKAIHRHPHDTRYWLRLLGVLLETDMKTFCRCAEKTLHLSRSTVDTNIVHVACASSFSHFTQNGQTNGVRSAQKVFFTYPAAVESWATFIAALLPRCADTNSKLNAQWLSTFISIVQTKYEITQTMSEWLSCCKQKVNTIAGDGTET